MDLFTPGQSTPLNSAALSGQVVCDKLRAELPHSDIQESVL